MTLYFFKLKLMWFAGKIKINESIFLNSILQWNGFSAPSKSYIIVHNLFVTINLRPNKSFNI